MQGLSSIRRLWQPRRGLFWLALGFNLLSSALAWALHLGRPGGLLLGLLTVLALTNSALGAWALWRLWVESGPVSSPTPSAAEAASHVSSPADHR